MLQLKSDKLLGESLTKSIANDFNWEFSSTLDEISIFKKIDRITDKTIIIFIDGIDEWSSTNKVTELGNFASNISNRNIKVVLSCKKYPWETFTMAEGTPTKLSELTYQFKNDNAYSLKGFEGKNFHQLIEKHRDFFNFRGAFETKVIQECKKYPFLLRVFFSLSEHEEVTHLTFSNKMFFEKYFNLLLETFKQPEREQVTFQLKGVAKCLLESGSDSIDMEEIRSELNISANSVLHPGLFEKNILESTTINFSTKVSFYFQKTRDYIIATLIKRWDSADKKSILDDYSHIQTNDVLYEALKVFYSITSEEKQKILDSTIRENAEKYLRFYSDVIDTHFKNLKTILRPETGGEIGFIGEYNLKDNALSMYGFRKIDKGDQQIKFVLQDGTWTSDRNNLTEIHGGNWLHATDSANGFTELDIRNEVIKHEIITQIKELVNNTNLNEKGCFSLSLEKVLGTLDFFNFFPERHRYGTNHYLPLSYEEIDKRIHVKAAKSYFRNKLIEERRKNGLIKEEWKGGIVSFNVNFSSEDHKKIEQLALESVENEINIDYVFDVDSKKHKDILETALRTIKNSWESIESTLIKDPDFQTKYIFGGVPKGKRNPAS